MILSIIIIQSIISQNVFFTGSYRERRQVFLRKQRFNTLMESEQYDWVTFDDDEDIIWTGKPRVAAVIKTALFTMFLPVGAYFYSGIGAAGIALLIQNRREYLTPSGSG